MAMDTRDKRASSLGVGLPFLRTFPVADGTINAGDRKQTTLSYRGIAAGASTQRVFLQPSGWIGPVGMFLAGVLACLEGLRR